MLILYTAITDIFYVPYDGFCFDLTSNALYVSIIIPKNSSNAANEPDCFCPISEVTSYTVVECGCIDDTIFKEPITASSTMSEGSIVYQFCFSGLEPEMNNTVIHIVTFYRYCTATDRYSIYAVSNDDVPYIEFLKSFKMSIGIKNLVVYVYSNK